MPQVRQLPPIKGHPQQKWEVSNENTVIGWVEGKHLRGARNTYYQAIAIHPNGKHYNIEGSYDFEEQVERLLRFSMNPSEFNHHLPHNARMSR